MITFLLLSSMLTVATQPSGTYTSQLIFPPQKQHNHGSCIVELPNGDLLTAWYRGSGERQADDVVILGSRIKKGGTSWSEPFLMADTPGYPDCNASMIIDQQKRLWLLYPTILDNHWESAITRYKISRDYQKPGVPKWEVSDDLLPKPGPEFLTVVERDLEKMWAPTLQAATDAQKETLQKYLAEKRKRAQDKLSVRLGWMPRAHPFLADNGRLIIPLYSDGFDFSLMSYTDDGSATWKVSEPLVGPGNVQPSLARRKDGALVAYFRDNGPPPQRVIVSESRDNGHTWSPSRDIDLPNPGSGLEVVALKSGRWLLICNPTERGRHAIGMYISDDEGRTWPRIKYLEKDDPGAGAGSYSYPSIIQGKDGTIHATYSYTVNRANREPEGTGETIKYARFSEAWLLDGSARP
jgi:predicted neuraminidase